MLCSNTKGHILIAVPDNSNNSMAGGKIDTSPQNIWYKYRLFTPLPLFKYNTFLEISLTAAPREVIKFEKRAYSIWNSIAVCNKNMKLSKSWLTLSLLLLFACLSLSLAEGVNCELGEVSEDKSNNTTSHSITVRCGEESVINFSLTNRAKYYLLVLESGGVEWLAVERADDDLFIAVEGRRFNVRDGLQRGEDERVVKLFKQEGLRYVITFLTASCVCKHTRFSAILRQSRIAHFVASIPASMSAVIKILY